MTAAPRHRPLFAAVVAFLPFPVLVTGQGTAFAAPDPGEPAAHPGASVAERPESVPAEGKIAVPVEKRDEVLGKGYRRSGDTAWTTAADGKGPTTLRGMGL